jgi:hypothetical protein
MGDTQGTWVDGMQFVAESAGHSIIIMLGKTADIVTSYEIEHET